MDRFIFICNCSSLEHQLCFWYDEEYKILYTEVHLITYRGFFKRLWYGLRYAFGYKSRFGAWDEFLFETDDMIKLKEFINNTNYGKKETED